MRWEKGHFWTTIISFVIPIIAALLFLYLGNNKNLKFLFESESIEFVELDKNYNFIEDEDNLITIDKENHLIIFEYHKIKYNKIIIEGNKITAPLNTEYIIQGKFYELNDDLNLQRIIASKKLKEALTENKIAFFLNIVITVSGFVLGGVIIYKKMDVMKKYRRFGVSISLLFITLFTAALSLITTQIFVVFGALFLGWTAYTISWATKRKLNGLPIFEDQRVRVVIENE